MNKTPVTEGGIDVIGRKGMLSVNCASNKYENQLANDCTHSVHEAEINITVPIKDVGKMLPQASLAIMGKSVQSYSILVVDPHNIPIRSPLHPHHISIEAISPLNPHIHPYPKILPCCISQLLQGSVHEAPLPSSVNHRFAWSKVKSEGFHSDFSAQARRWGFTASWSRILTGIQLIMEMIGRVMPNRRSQYCPYLTWTLSGVIRSEAGQELYLMQGGWMMSVWTIL